VARHSAFPLESAEQFLDGAHRQNQTPRFLGQSDEALLLIERFDGFVLCVHHNGGGSQWPAADQASMQRIHQEQAPNPQEQAPNPLSAERNADREAAQQCRWNERYFGNLLIISSGKATNSTEYWESV
jgi:hypothetical protein